MCVFNLAILDLSLRLRCFSMHNCILTILHDVLPGVVTGQESSCPGVIEDELLMPFISGKLSPTVGIVLIMPGYLGSRIHQQLFPEFISGILEEENMSR